MNRPRLAVLVSSLSLAFVFSTFASQDAEATPFKGKVITSHKRFPTTAKSKKAYFAKLRKQKRSKFQEDKKKKQWKVYFAAFFKKKLNDLEVTIKLYDVTGKQKVMKAGFEQYLDRRGQKEIISYLKLDRDKFGVNRRIEIQVVNRGRVLAKGRFHILGEEEKYSGKVEFSKEDTKKP